MDRIAISSGKREPAQGESKDDQGNDKKKALISCGLAGLEKIGNNNQNSVKSTYLLLVLFFAPIFAGFYRRNA